MFKEFKEFAVRGNVVDMAVGVIMGGAFGKVITSFLNDVVMPPLGLLTGGVDFNDKAVLLKAAEGEAKAVAVNYGTFLTVTIDFVLVSLAVFLLVRGINTLRKTAPPAPSEKPCPECLMNIPLKARRCAHCASAVPA